MKETRGGFESGQALDAAHQSSTQSVESGFKALGLRESGNEDRRGEGDRAGISEVSWHGRWHVGTPDVGFGPRKLPSGQCGEQTLAQLQIGGPDHLKAPFLN